MSILRVVSRYSKSLFDISKSNGNLNQVHEDVMELWNIVKADEMRTFLKSPIISSVRKADVFEKLLKNFDQSLLQTLLVMIEHKREAYISDFCRAFHLLYNKENKVSQAKLITADTIGEDTVKELLDTFKQKGFLEADVELIKEIDSSIIGGFILEFDGKVYNASLLHSLDQLKKKFNENLYIKNL